MWNKLLKNYLLTVSVLAMCVFAGQVYAGWSDLSKQGNYNKRYGDFPPLDIDEQLQNSMNEMEAEAEAGRAKNSAQAVQQSTKQSSTQSTTNPSLQPSNGTGNNTGMVASPRATGMQAIPGGSKKKYKGGQKNRNSGFDFPFGNNGSGFNAPWNNRRSSVNAPWSNNRGSGFNPPWDNNSSGFGFPWGNNNNNNNNFSFGPWGNNRRHR